MDVEMRSLVCGECGIVFAMPERYVEDRIKDHKTFYCPSGHARHFPGKSDEEKLREKLKIKEEEAAAKGRLLEQSREAVKSLQMARTKMIVAFVDDHFAKGNKTLMLSEFAKHFGLKVREAQQYVGLAGFKCVRADKGYQIVKVQKEK